jgi:hypothetical protein
MHALIPSACAECSGAIATGERFKVRDGRRVHERCAELADQVDARVAVLVAATDGWSQVRAAEVSR